MPMPWFHLCAQRHQWLLRLSLRSVLIIYSTLRKNLPDIYIDKTAEVESSIAGLYARFKNASFFLGLHKGSKIVGFKFENGFGMLPLYIFVSESL